MMARNSNNRRRYQRGRRKNKGFKTWSFRKKLITIFSCLIVLLLSSGIVYAANKYQKIEKQEVSAKELDISKDVVHEKGYLNVALFGLDSRDGTLGEGNLSDTIMIASLNQETGEVRLVSVFRDTLLELKDGSLNKANSAYAFGGPEDGIALINKNMDLNIDKYVAVNFNALVDIIDALGGVEIELTLEEIGHLNNYSVETSEVTGVSYTALPPEAGTYNLCGVQAVSYARIRYTEGGDFKRAERQRLVLELIAEKTRRANIGTLNKIIDKVFPQVSTNFTLADILTYAKDILHFKMGESMGFPSTNEFAMLSQVGSVVVPVTLESNVKEVHSFLFGDNGYLPSDTLKSVSASVAARASGQSTESAYTDEDEDFYVPYTDTTPTDNYYEQGNESMQAPVTDTPVQEETVPEQTTPEPVPEEPLQTE
ncbi:LCP family protein required for cell wall assembly [Aequitasia blattaphilus]|uniref:LCP family protein n=2 Tax=Aequitasia blattaphilus TaxID=2949332 RepID=A0ABT1E696_9FIRM|nr:LCP family protein [Aequitasia blattaphilus]MCP1101356.1 LCP family protein [Aequitasia blattaphilus]MCR8613996.1 LCP family protein [Aequitasia blattaphilus]